ncbi:MULTISPECIES: DNA/RNA helicase domain-containing protein [Streptomyces]|uniref:DNA/RNA helicase domain-containing protein n=1 Tax=Streptomyces lycopersici TaxID=2974589 RepID=UPI0021CE799F|nr:DNA/RNA helicase domain-containing protein [Streptomyces sp. NEAU-383]
MAAGLSDLHVLLEYFLPGTGERVDALLLGRQAGEAGLTAVAIELKQWTRASWDTSRPLLLDVGDRQVTHPARQVGGYVHYLDNWISDSLGLTVRGAAVLHNAGPDLVSALRQAVAGGASAPYPIVGRQDLDASLPAREIATRLDCADLEFAPAPLIETFLQTRHRPKAKLLSRVADHIDGSDRFVLIGDQDTARLAILDAVRAERRKDRRHIVVVSGGPGTGKTAIALRMFADLARQSQGNPRLLCPSATLSRQFTRAASDAAKGMIKTFTSGLPAGLTDESVVLVDEVHRAHTYPGQRRAEFPVVLEQLVNRCAVTVLFLDERQIVRPTEGTTLDELQRMATRHGHSLTSIDLTTQFRCNGSQAYQRWIDTLFSRNGTPQPWTSGEYDLAAADNPRQLEAWTAAHIHNDRSARITAGFCWPWKSPERPPLLPEVSIGWKDEEGEHLWERPWNSRAANTAGDDQGVPARAFWATDPGGHQQIGCIYTAQGLEYDYGTVILGDDLVRTPSGWRARPEASHDDALRHLPAEEYLTYALNTYRVLATRGTQGTRFYSTDPETQAYLRTLLPAAAAAR